MRSAQLFLFLFLGLALPLPSATAASAPLSGSAPVLASLACGSPTMLWAFMASPALTTFAAASDEQGHASDADHGEHDGGGHGEVDRSGDAALFGELFEHLVPHPLTALWFGGDKGLATVLPYAADAHGQPLKGSAEHPAHFESSAELTEHYAEEFGGGFGILIYNINTAMWIAGALLFALFLPVRKKAQALAGKTPRGGVFYGIMEPMVLFVRDEMVYAIMGKERGRSFVPLFLTMFFFILLMNLLGLVSIGSMGGTATANLAVTAGLSTVTLLWIHCSGVMKFGPVRHALNFIPHGIPWFAIPIIVVVEMIGILVKPFALTVRLFANMTAGHLIVLALFGLIYFFASYLLALPILGMAVGIYALEVFVAFVQAYVFTYLSILFVGASIHPEH